MNHPHGLTAPNMNWLTVIEHHADRYPDKAALLYEGTQITYAELLSRVRGLAHGLSTQGLERGDVIGLLLHNSPTFIELFLAACHLGAVAMPVNTRLTSSEVEYLVSDSRARMLVTDAELAPIAMGLLDTGHPDPPVVVTANGAPHPGSIALDDLRLKDLGEPCARLAGSDLQRLMYTSGTTSRPKGVMLSHENLAWKVFSHVTEFGFSPNDVGLVCGPLYHVGALDATATNLLHVGGTVVIHRRFDARSVAEELAHGGVTNAWMAPAMLSLLMELPGIEEYDLSGVRLVIAGGEKMPESKIARLQELFPAAWFADAFGLTEYISADTVLARRMTRDKLGSVGKPCTYVEIAIWDPEDRPLPAGVHGEIVTRSPKVFQGYWNKPEETERAFRGGWFHTGDLGYLDEEGYLYVVDRLKDVIVSGGENVASLEVERVLYEHPAVAEAAVVARPDARWGEVPHAVVVLHAGTTCDAKELQEHCYAHLARYKVPKSFDFIDALPRNLAGKILKRELRQQVAVASPPTYEELR